MVCACFYDENDNFRNKLWVLTSYDASRKEEDKLRKVVSEETAFKKEVNSSSPLQYSLEKGVTLSTFSPDSRLSGNFWLVSFKISYLCLPLFYETRTTPSCHPSGCAYRQL